MIEAVAPVIGIKGAGSQPPQEFMIADAMFDKLTQEIGIPKTDEDEVRLEGAMTTLQQPGQKWEQRNPIFSFLNKNTYQQLCDIKRRMVIMVESVFINKHGFRAPFVTHMLADVGEYGDILIKYNEDNFVRNY